jgi:hypothetical protein
VIEQGQARATLYRVALGLGLFTILEVAFYPSLATWAFLKASGRPGWDGSALPFVQLVGAVPAGLVLLGLCGASAFLASRGRVSLAWTLMLAAWLFNLVGFVASVLWYSRIPHVV